MSEEPMSLLARLARRPQALLLRRALFQVHLWIGIAAGLYVAMMSVTGSLIVWRVDLDKMICPRHVAVAQAGPRLDESQMIAAARAAVPRLGDVEVRVLPPRSQAEAVEVWYMRGNEPVERLIDPYTGKLLGSTIDCEPRWVTLAVELHDHLLLGDATGLLANGVGALLLTVLVASGALLWWPGIMRWRRSLVVRWRGSWQRFAWELHSASGFWTFLLVIMWALTGIYLSFPDYFAQFIYEGEDGPAPLPGLEPVVRWLVRLHFGRSFGSTVKVAWTVLGMVPALMFLSGLFVWWQRVVRRRPAL